MQVTAPWQLPCRDGMVCWAARPRVLPGLAMTSAATSAALHGDGDGASRKYTRGPAAMSSVGPTLAIRVLSILTLFRSGPVRA